MTLIDVLKDRPQDLLLHDEDLSNETLKSVKSSFDPIAKDFSIFDELHVSGLDAEQVWAQAQMVVDGVVNKLLTEDIPSLAGSKRTADEMMDSEDDEEELDSEDEEMFDAEETIDQDQDQDEEDSEDEYQDAVAHPTVEQPEDESEEEEEEGEEESGKKQPPGAALNDRFFNIDDFNQQVLAMEQEDYDMDDEDEDIDMFKDVQGESGDEEAKYNDFFDPPDKKTKKTVKIQAPDQDEDFEGLNVDASYGNVEHAMESARKELFDSDDEEEDEDENEGLSTFEKQQQDIMKQIKELEDENVAEKHWAKKGEVRRADRPHESLVFEDLDFERSSKPVPVMTQEAIETLEEMIKRRIKNEDFDDIPRRLPTATPTFRKSRDADVQETKSQKSLAELYEDDYRKENDASYSDSKQEQLDEAHQEVVDLYNSIAHKLDALCSWNYTPKAPKPTISIRSNAASISMEDAQPTAANASTMLAPQEVYQPEADSKREVIGRNNMPMAKAEMTRDERKRQRKRVKAKKANAAEQKHEKQRAQAASNVGGKADVMQTLKKGNVTIIDKKGEKRDVDGKLQKDKRAKSSSGFKLG